MSLRFAGSLIALAASTCFTVALIGPSSAESVRKECSQKYQAAKAAGTLNGQAWPQFYSQCAAEAKGAPAAPAAAPRSRRCACSRRSAENRRRNPQPRRRRRPPRLARRCFLPQSRRRMPAKSRAKPAC